MSQQSPARNPFMLMVNPEVVFSAIENSERLSGLNRHLCRPLDRPLMAGVDAAVSVLSDSDDEVLDCDD